MRNAALFFIIILLPTIVFAEITNCNGVWTTEPCQGKVTAKIEEKAYTPPAPEEAGHSSREEMLQSLSSAQINLRQKFNEVVDISDVRELCLLGTTTAVECQEAVGKRRDEIAQREISLQNLQNTNKEVSDGESPREENVVIVQDNSGYQDELSRRPLPPIYQDPHAIPPGSPGLGKEKQIEENLSPEGHALDNSPPQRRRRR